MRRIPIILFIAVFVACSSPYDTPLPKDLSQIETIKPAVEKLKQDERELLAAYVIRHTASSMFGSAFGIKADPIPDGMTIGKAIAEQREFAEKQKTADAARKAEKEKIDTMRKALAEQMSQVLSARLIGLQLHQATYRDLDIESYIKVSIEFDNKGAKTINGLKGIATFKDKFGDTISDVRIKVEQQIPSGKKIIIHLAKPFNKFEKEDRKLANYNADSVDFIVSPELILFDDGSKFEAPKPTE